MRRESRCSPYLQMPNRSLITASDTFGEGFQEKDWLLSLKGTLHPKKPLTNPHPDAKLDPGPSVQLHHQVNVHKDAHQWEDRQSRDL